MIASVRLRACLMYWRVCCVLVRVSVPCMAQMRGIVDSGTTVVPLDMISIFRDEFSLGRWSDQAIPLRFMVMANLTSCQGIVELQNRLFGLLLWNCPCWLLVGHNNTSM